MLIRATRALSELRKLCHAVAEGLGADRSGPFPVDTLHLSLTVDLRRAHHDRDDAAAAEHVLRAVRRHLRDALKGIVAHQPGHVFCFLCDTPMCVHSLPPDPRSVFAGYTATGKPVWTTFTNLCLQLGDERVDQLYADPPDVIAVVQPAHALQEGLLPDFGRDSEAYAVLGQVAVGLLPHGLRATSGPGGADRFAMSVQVVETRSSHEPWRLQLNVIGLPPDELTELAGAQGARGPAESLRRTLREASHRVAGMTRRVREARRRGERLAPDAMVTALLVQLKGDLERIFRAGKRRTLHGQQRHMGGDRPTGSAYGDARHAPNDKLLRDERRATVVVLGPKGRTHVFTGEGKHVTSLSLERSEVERRVETQRWRPLTPLEADAFRATLLQAEGHPP